MIRPRWLRPIVITAGLAVGPASAAALNTTPDCQARIDAAPAQFASYACIPLAARRDGRVAQAERQLEALGRDPARRPYALAALGLLYIDRHDSRAERTLAQASDALQAVGNRNDAAFVEYYRFDQALALGDRVGAQAHLDRAHRLAPERPSAPLRWTLRLGDTQLAAQQARYGAATSICAAEDDPEFGSLPDWLRYDLRSACGAALWGVGEKRTSRAALEQALAIARASGDRFLEAAALDGVLILASQTGASPGELLALAEQGINAATTSGNRSAEAGLRLSLGQFPSLPLARRRAELEQGRALATETDDYRRQCFALREIARLLLFARPYEPADVREADRLTRLAIDEAQQRGDPFHLARGLIRLSLNQWIAGGRDQALSRSLAALDAIEQIRDTQPDELSRARVADEWSFFYGLVVSNLLSSQASPSDQDRAFEIAERLRARLLLSALDQAHVALEPAEDSEQASAIDRLLHALIDTRRQLAIATPEGRARWLAQLERQTTQLAGLRARAAASDPQRASWRFPLAVDRAAVQARLRPDEAMLVFHHPDGANRDLEAVVWTLTRDRVRITRLGALTELRSICSLLALAMARGDGSESAALATLSRLLLAESLTGLTPEIRTLAIVPERQLYRVPFDALPYGPDANPLAQRFEISIAPSVALWLRWRDQPAPPAALRGLLALADPYPASHGAGAGARTSLDALPHARQEAQEIAALWPAEVRLRIGERASAAALRAALSEEPGIATRGGSAIGVVHVAAHALVDEHQPQRSCLRLAPGSGDDDGCLTSAELAALPLSRRTVVLAACHSATGELLGGEGAMSLTRALLVAGADSVVGTLWEVNDADTRLVMTSFYRHLASGQTPARAMAAARRERIAAGASVASWGAFTVTGAGTSRLETAPQLARWLDPRPLGALLLGALALAVAQRSARSPRTG